MSAYEFEQVPVGETTLREQKMVELLKAFGDERYTDLVDELTFIEPDMIDEPIVLPTEGNVPEEEDEPEIPAAEAVEEPVVEDILQEEPEVQAEPEPEEPVETEEQRAAREDRERREEAKAILTQQILPRAVPVKPAKVQAEPSEGTRKQAVTVHPAANDSIKPARRKKRRGSLFLDLTESSEDNNEAQIQSAVRQVLDETEGK